MGSTNNNLSKQGIQDIYRRMITEFDNTDRDSSILRERLNKISVRNEKKGRLVIARELLRGVIKDVEGFQDRYGMSTNLYYTIKEFLDE